MTKNNGQFRFAYFTSKYEETVAFYRDSLGMPVLEDWEHSAEDRGTLIGAAGGMIEVLSWPTERALAHQWDVRPPQGAFMVIEVEDLAACYALVKAKGLPVTHELADQTWGHRSFCVTEPNGLTLYLFNELSG